MKLLFEELSIQVIFYSIIWIDTYCWISYCTSFIFWTCHLLGSKTRTKNTCVSLLVSTYDIYQFLVIFVTTVSDVIHRHNKIISLQHNLIGLFLYL